MTLNRFLIVFCSVFASALVAQHDPHTQPVIPKVSPALRFTENMGQWENTILFRAQLDGGALFLQNNALTFSFYDKKKYRALHHGGILKGKYKDMDIACHAYKVHFDNCNPVPVIEKFQAGSDYENFFIGNDETKWKSNVRNYHQVWLRELYKGIDYEILTAVNGVKYTFHLKPGSDPNSIKMRYEGIDKLRTKNGALLIKLAVNEVIEQKPYAYQLIGGAVKVVPCIYRVKDNVAGFDFPAGYDKNYELVIDPLLVFAAQSGSTADNFGMTATFDPQGNLYSGGTVFNNGYPVTFGAFSTSFNGGSGMTDVVITKYNSTGNSLLYSTYLGGNMSEIVTSLIVDGNNNLCFYGATGSANFPMTIGTYDPTFNGGQYLSFIYNGTTFNNGTDIYVGKFNASGTALLGCTYLGGSGNDGVNHVNHLSPILVFGNTYFEYDTDSLQFNYGDQYRGEIQLDNQNNIYIASSTRSSNFPTVNAYDNSLGGKQDAIVAKFNSGLTQLLFCTYLGGSLNECGNSLIVNASSEVFVTGGTCSSNFPTTLGAFDNSYNGGKTDGFITHLNAGGNGLLQSTFLGTSNYDQPYFIQSDKYNNIYVYGQSLGNMPVMMAPNETTIYNVPNTHQFITRLNPTLSAINMSMVFGNFTGLTDISPSAFAVDKCNNIYISGWGGNIITGPAFSNMPLLQPTQSTTNGFDFYFMGLDSNAKALKYGSYFGGAYSSEHVDGGTSRFDPSGRIYQSVCAGCGGYDDFPVTPGAWPGTPGNPNHAGNCNNGVIKLDFQLQMAISTIQTNTVAGCTPLSITFTNGTQPPGSSSTYTWDLGNGITTSSILNPTATYTAAGIYTISLTVRDNLTCNKTDKTVTYITVYPKPTASISYSTNPCSNVIFVSNASTGSLGANPHFWSFGSGMGTSTLSSATYTYPSNGTYNVSYTVTDINGCKDATTVPVPIFNFSPGVVSNGSVCIGQTTTITASGGTNYTWSPGSSLSSTQVAAPLASPLVTTIYTVVIVNSGPGYSCAKTLTTQMIVLPGPTSNFSLSSNPCSNTVSTTNSSTGNLNTIPYAWNFGNGSPIVTAAAPFYTYPGNGTYTVSLTVTDVDGCQHTTSQVISIFNFTPGVVSSSSLCYGLTTTITAAGGTNYTWTPASSLSNTSIAGPSANPTVTTIYTVNIANDSPGYTCSKTLTTQILVNPTPTTSFNFSINPCGGGVYFLDQSASDITAWQWTLSPTKTSSVQSPYNFYKAGGTYTVTLITTNSYGCKNSLEKTLTVPTPPPLSISRDTAICIGGAIQLDAEGGVLYQWTPAESLDFSNVHNPIANPKVTTEYSVNIITSQVVDGKTCEFVLTVEVRVDVLSKTPVKAFANPVLVTTGDPTTLTYLGDPGALVTWLPLGATTPPIGYTVIAYPVKPTTYTAVATRGVCREVVEVNVDAFTAGCSINDFFVPNTFTPNGDGENDILYVRGLKIDEVYFTVYNRWGEKVFETNDKNKGWDGRYKGKDADIGVFGWYLKAKCVNGAEAFHKGNVTLIR
ncbi:MAG: PKD domain-containing protein [bacterium]|nr:PKD domain-containing protein [bacterium]